MNKRVKMGLLLPLFILIILSGFFYFSFMIAKMVYPLKYESEIKECADNHKIPVFLVAGLIYTESRFNENAISKMGAMGLMQIMPQTAQRISKTMGRGDFSYSKLYDPKYNIKLGCYYLKQLIDKNNGDLIKALLAYNAGEQRVIDFEKKMPIPQETSNFIKKVNDMWGIYEKIYGRSLIAGQAEQKNKETIQRKQLGDKIKEAEKQGLILKADNEKSFLSKIWRRFRLIF